MGLALLGFWSSTCHLHPHIVASLQQKNVLRKTADLIQLIECWLRGSSVPSTLSL